MKTQMVEVKAGSQSLHMCQVAHQASTDKNNLTKKTIYHLLVVCSQCPIALDINIEDLVKPPEVIWHQTIKA